MIASDRITTEDVAPHQRLALIRHAADKLFNLDTRLHMPSGESAVADIHALRAFGLSSVHVRTSASSVRRSKARMRAANSGNLLLYAVHGGTTLVETARGEHFTTRAGSLFVGSQDAAYQATTQPGTDWDFSAFGVPEHLLPESRDLIRDGGFRLLDADAPIHGVLSSFAANIFHEFPVLTGGSAIACVRALDHLLAASLRGEVRSVPDLDTAIASERRRAALRCAERELASPGLSPERVARHLRISPRQLHRAFEAAGLSLTGEIRRLRLDRAARLILTQPAIPVTEVAMRCGFGSLASFYRLFKARYAMTASQWRGASEQAAPSKVP